MIAAPPPLWVAPSQDRIVWLDHVSQVMTGAAQASASSDRVYRFARLLPRGSKAGTLDAQMLAQLARERQPSPWIPPPQVYHELRQRLRMQSGLERSSGRDG